MTSERLPSGEVHLWFLPQEQGLLDELAVRDSGLLSPAELARLQSFRSPLSGRRFQLQRILLRRGLAHYLDADPGGIEFTQGLHGKPALAQPSNPGLCFSLSHSGAAAVLAVACSDRLGVDLEALEHADRALKISKRFFSEAERRLLARSSVSAGHDALSLWVLKESVAKALGETVWDGLTGVGLRLEDARISWLMPPPEGSEQDWALMLGQLRSTHLLAVVLNAAAVQLRPAAWRAYTLGLNTSFDQDADLLLRLASSRREPILP